MSKLYDLRDLAGLARRSIDPGLATDATGVRISAGACLHASLVVVMLVSRFGCGRAVVRGGGDAGAGARDVQGAWHGHYWVEVVLPVDGAFVVDVTADQFGYEPVVVLPLMLAQDRYRPGPQREVDEAVEGLTQEFGCQDLIAA